MQHFDMWRVRNEEHDIILHASDAEDALYCIGEGWPEGIGEAYLSRIDESQFPDLELGTMRDLKQS